MRSTHEIPILWCNQIWDLLTTSCKITSHLRQKLNGAFFSPKSASASPPDVGGDFSGARCCITHLSAGPAGPVVQATNISPERQAPVCPESKTYLSYVNVSLINASKMYIKESCAHIPRSP